MRRRSWRFWAGEDMLVGEVDLEVREIFVAAWGISYEI